MPVYNYQCGSCGNRIEIVQSFSGGIPLCCGKDMGRLPTAPAMIVMKGTHSEGYKRDYAKDYRRRLAETS